MIYDHLYGKYVSQSLERSDSYDINISYKFVEINHA